ncbi:MAG: cytochrome c oxidase subunit 3 [Vicinamibacterales bacterium]|nr:cytochrome c oxidase subunit 3 [Vicinamibacterales bacterium]
MAHAASPSIDRWAGGTCPFEAGWRKVMMWAFIITDGLLFAGLLAAYGYARGMAGAWPDQSTVFDLRLIAAMTFTLITSSATMASAVAVAQAGRMPTAGRYILATLAGGAIFLGLQAYEWTHLIQEGGGLTTNPWGDPLFGTYFYVLTGFHGTHVLTGLIVLAVTALRLRAGKTRPEGVELAGLYWHFVDLVWVFVFTLFYLL